MTGSKLRLSLILFLLLIIGAPACSQSPDENNNYIEFLTKKFEEIDQNMPGNLGVYLRIVDEENAVRWNANRSWYLSSTVKVPVAIALLKKVEEGELNLSDKLILRETDYVDGAGDLLWTDPGIEYSLEDLMQKMLVQSDNTATDMLIRLIGEEELNRQITEYMVENGFTPFTTLLQVRYDAYSKIHPDVERLTNMDFIEIHASRDRTQRFNSFIERLQVQLDEASAASIEEAFEQYYTLELNSSTLEAFGRLLERLVNRELLSDEHTEMILDMMKNIVTGDHRIKAGLPAGTPFAHKTGTQIERACNMGIVDPDNEKPIIIAACAENYGELSNAENAFQQIGAALYEAGLLNRNN